MKTVLAKATEKVKLTAKLSDDKVKLFIDAERASETALLREDLLGLLSEIVKREEVDIGVLDDILKKLNSGEKVTERRVAKGRPPEQGIDGKVLLLVKKFTGHGEVKPDEKGFIDYSSVHLFDNIASGQTVGRLYPPKAGQDGVSAIGEKLPSKPGKPIKPNLDRSIKLVPNPEAPEEYQLLVAQNDGMLVEEGGKLIVKEEFYVDGDLDFRFGNLDFIGKIVIKGDVNSGFVVKARKGIEVRGALNGGSLICSEGDVIIKELARGGKGARVVCGRDLELKVAQELDAQTGGNIKVHKQALDCQLRAAAALLMGSAELMGGVAHTACGAEVKLIGNSKGLSTRIVLCSDVEATYDYEKLMSEIANHNKALELIELHLGPLAKNPARITLLKEPHRGKMETLYRKHSEVERSRSKLLDRQKEMLAAGRTSEVLRVNYIGAIYPGVEISAGDAVFRVADEKKGPAGIEFIAAEKKFVETELKPLQCSTGAAAKEPEGEKKHVR